ncbi:hypothetical protein A6395_13435 [Exiguobacterium sp. SH31]|uniref:hypothetical protein n=1 Tax=Exiguobacterium sp. SH31 TaxID=1843183 RepID=UPI0008AEBFC4|nr:hypothetical protein [Exiguobacterium sp. SH31]OGX78133.1 hypothetical protein A6395_13435 [Exiguobacterium sp. SH31]
MLRIVLISLIVMFLMTVFVFYSSLGHMGVQSVRRKLIYTVLGTTFAIKMAFNFKGRLSMITRHLKTRGKPIPSNFKLMMMVFLDSFDIKRNIEALTFSSAAFEEDHPVKSKSTNSIQAGIEDYDYIREYFKEHNISR